MLRWPVVLRPIPQPGQRYLALSAGLLYNDVSCLSENIVQEACP